MTFVEDFPYHLYGRGFDVDSLRLGHLVIGEYHSPLKIRRHKAWILPIDPSWQSDNALKGTFQTRQSIEPRVRIDILAIANIGASKAKDADTLSQLRLWATVMATDKLRWFRAKPKIWMLTGLFQLNDATVTTLVGNESELGAGLTSAPLTAAGLPAVGASASLRNASSSAATVHVVGPQVWAGRWHLVEVVASTPSEPPHFRLHGDITSKGQFRSGGDCYNADVRLRLGRSLVPEGEVTSIDEEQYWQEFDQVVAKYELWLQDGDE